MGRCVGKVSWVCENRKYVEVSFTGYINNRKGVEFQQASRPLGVNLRLATF